MNSIWRPHIWRAKGRDTETVEFWPGNRKPCSSPVHLHATGSWRSGRDRITRTSLPNWYDYCIMSLWETEPVKALTMCSTIFVFSITGFICNRNSVAFWGYKPRVGLEDLYWSQHLSLAQGLKQGKELTWLCPPLKIVLYMLATSQ